MDALVIFCSKDAAAFVEPVQPYLTQAGTDARWEVFESFEETPVDALVVAVESDLTVRQQRLLAARRVILLAEAADFAACTHFMALGVLSCLPRDDVERIALEIISLETQRRRSADTAAGSDLLQSVIDAIPVPIFFKDEHHIYRGCNKAFAEAMGRPRRGIVGHSVYDIAPAELADRYHQADCELLAKGGHQRYEAPVRFADGRNHSIEFNKAVFYHADGRPAGQVGAMLDITERNELIEKLKRTSFTDPLTGAGNRREFNQVVSTAVAEHRETGQPLSLLVLDLDYFKTINDRFGHAVGDQTLQFLVETCTDLLREDDHLFRVGGEEFYMLLPRTALQEAQGVAQRLCNALRNTGLAVDEGEVRMTASIGVTEVLLDCPLDESLARGDKALYKAKREGRDRVALADN